MRSYTAQNIIALPTLNTAAAVALGQGLITAAKAQTALPELISKRIIALEKTHGALHQALSQKPQTETDLQRIRVADAAEDQAWRAMHDWLGGWGRLTTPEADSANTIHGILFPTGLKFIRLPYRLEWAEADAKLTRITNEGYDIEIQKLGGQVILDQLKTVHKSYGEALGITAEGQDTKLGFREPLTAFTKSLRAYVLAVAAHADPEDQPSIDLTDALLAPLQNWQSYNTATAPQPEPPAPVPPTPGAPTPGVSTTPGSPTPSGTSPVPTNGPGVEPAQH